ncbi:hypothetical protein DSECCO2_563120 [anaerobic digester metagenome]
MIDEKTIEQARNTDIVAFLERWHGFTFAHRGGAYRCRQHPSLAVKNDRLSWFWHSRSIGGHGAIDYLMKMEHMPFRQAVKAISGITPPTVPSRQEEPPKVLILPEKAGISLRLYDYLCGRRGIDSGIVNTLIQKEKLYEDRRGNVVFVGHDELGKARFASLRGTYGDPPFRGDRAGSDKRYSFSMAACAPSGRLYIFESPIDAMSHASLENAAVGDAGAWKRHNRLSLAGTSDTALPFFLNQHPAVRELIFCLDNDPAGREAVAVMARKYVEKGYHTSIILPAGKDFNEDLRARAKQIRAEKQPKSSHRDVTI